MSLLLVLALLSAAPDGADRGSFGLRAEVGGGLPSYSPVVGAAANAPSRLGTFGLSFFTSPAVLLTAEVQLGVVSVGTAPRLGVGGGFAFEYLFRAGRAVRPFLRAGLSVERATPTDLANVAQELPSLNLDVGTGVFYFPVPELGLFARIGVGVAWRPGLGARAPAGAVSIAGTVIPAAGLAWFF